ncbi:retention module-containing protein, partial [Saccharophagus degradans]|uniref:retention module-containing protein n=1 Tax=Saccharophagus degradans TaxID=86304 RepID=UPI001C096DD3
MAEQSPENNSSSENSGKVLGKIVGVQGEVYVDSPNGKAAAGKAQLALNHGDTVRTLGSSAVVIQLEGGKSLTLGHDETLTLDDKLLALLNQEEEEGSLDEGVDFDALAEAIESGQNLEEILPAAAAGGDDPGTNSAGTAGSSGVRMDRTGDSVTPDSGFNTSNGSRSTSSNEVRSGDNVDDAFLAEANNNQPEAGVIENTTFNEDEFSQLDVSTAFNDSDPEQTLTYTAEGLPEGLELDPLTGIISGTPTNAAALLNGGTYTVVVTATDDSGASNNSASTSFTLQIANVNDAPEVESAPQLSDAVEDEPYIISNEELLAGASDIDQDELTVTNVSLVTGQGEIIANDDGTFTFNPAPNYNGPVEFSYTISDGQGGEIQNTATLNVTPVNDAPTAVGDGVVSTDTNVPVTVNVLANDFDVDGDEISIVSAEANQGTVTVNADGTLTYTPNEDFVGRDVLSYTITDGNGNTSTSFALVNIVVGNNAPQLGDDATVNVNENETAVGNFAATDADGDTITYSLEGADANLFTIDALGNLSFVTAPDFETNAGPFNVVVTATDNGLGNLSDSQSITINVLDVNENNDPNIAPVVDAALTVNGNEDDAPLVLDLLQGATDADGDTLSVSGVVLEGGNAIGVTQVGNNFEINPDAYNHLADGETETIAYRYTISDGNGGSVEQTATIIISGTNDAPQVSASLLSVAVDTDSAFNLNLLVGATDAESDALTVTNFTLVSGDDSGIVLNGNQLSVNPQAYAHLQNAEQENVTFNYIIEDGNGGTINQTATITITGTNNAPEVTSAIVANANEDDALFDLDLLAGASDVEGDALNVNNLTLVSGGASGVTVSGNSLSIDPNAYNALAVGESEVITYSYDVEDGNGGSVAQTATITIAGSNDAPTVSSAVTSLANEADAAYSLDLLVNASDPDASDVLNVSNVTLVSGDASGITINGNSLDVDPSAYSALASGESEVVTYSYDILDGNGGTVSQTATITITGDNAAPTVSAAVTSSASEDDSAYSVDLLENASDDDASNTLNVNNLTLTSGDASGITVNGNTLDVAPNAYNALAVGESEVITYSYEVEDGNGGSVAQTATITITGSNDAPTVSSAVTSTASEDDAAYSLDLLTNASDADGSDTLNVNNLTLVSGDASGITVSGNSLSIDPNAYNALATGESEVITYSYDVEDGNGGSVAQTATITITGSNDAPTVS